LQACHKSNDPEIIIFIGKPDHHDLSGRYHAACIDHKNKIFADPAADLVQAHRHPKDPDRHLFVPPMILSFGGFPLIGGYEDVNLRWDEHPEKNWADNDTAWTANGPFIWNAVKIIVNLALQLNNSESK